MGCVVSQTTLQTRQHAGAMKPTANLTQAQTLDQRNCILANRDALSVHATRQLIALVRVCEKLEKRVLDTHVLASSTIEYHRILNLLSSDSPSSTAHSGNIIPSSLTHEESLDLLKLGVLAKTV